MILLDTNVISEPLRKLPNSQVAKWMDAQGLETLYLSAITVAELRSGLAQLPEGKRRRELQKSLEDDLLPLFAGRVVPFDLNATQHYAHLIAKATVAGRPIGFADRLIAATAIANNYAVATRDTGPFIVAGTVVINPWEV